MPPNAIILGIHVYTSLCPNCVCVRVTNTQLLALNNVYLVIPTNKQRKLLKPAIIFNPPY